MIFWQPLGRSSTTQHSWLLLSTVHRQVLWPASWVSCVWPYVSHCTPSCSLIQVTCNHILSLSVCVCARTNALIHKECFCSSMWTNSTQILDANNSNLLQCNKSMKPYAYYYDLFIFVFYLSRHLFPLKHFNEILAEESSAKECYGCQKQFTSTAADKNVSYILKSYKVHYFSMTNLEW